MKRRLLIFIAMVLPLMAMSQGVINRSDKKPVTTVKKQNTSAKKQTKQQTMPSRSQQSARSTTFSPPTGYANNHGFVDLGLSVSWSTCNIGASSPTDCGNYYAWGETNTKADYVETNSKTFKRKIGDIAGNSQFDVARANWGDNWRLPTSEECQELLERCSWEWITKDDQTGYIVSSKINGNSIFLPASGFQWMKSVLALGEGGGFWCSSETNDTQHAGMLGFFSDKPSLQIYFRYYGITIRPVIQKSSSDKTNASMQSGGISKPTGYINNHGYVDLGLSVKWATCNVGANSPSDYGNHYAWGETNTKARYTVANSKCYNKEFGDIAGKSEYDAACANWGGSWRLPTKQEYQELIDKCSWKWIEIYGHLGYRIVSKINGNSIFLPAAGFRFDSDFLAASGEAGWYWSSSPHEGNKQSYYLDFQSKYHSIYWFDRNYGRSVRAVTE